MRESSLKEGEMSLLRTICYMPRTLKSLTHTTHRSAADIQLAPTTIVHYLERLVKRGLIDPPQIQNGSYCITAAGIEYLQALPEITPSTLITNASMPSGSYKPPAWPTRAGSEQHQQYKSRGIGA